ncbi:uncharacterized protein LOC114518719 [Dendronephthya gigantea]|uniref:uncharacterized protein LOC114518719 n=1 Tax=Dendronephthya gigantea TaxID=151771 RepID=UPI00106C11DA|nr:uncharacterized protein LOC114518719 [Dendronephthya gigantea]
MSLLFFFKLLGILSLQPKGQSSINIKTFGSNATNAQVIDVINLGIETAHGANIEVSAFTVILQSTLICQPLKNQFVLNASKTYPHLANLYLADYSSGHHDAKVDILISSDHYWKIVTGKTQQGIAVNCHSNKARLGSFWPVENESRKSTHTSNLATIHTLKCASEEVECKNDVLVQELKRFWDLETVGIQPHKGRLLRLLKLLHNEPEVLKKYDNVIRDQLNKGIVESTPKPNEEIKSMHYLPHHAVIRQDKTTTKLRVVYDASAKSRGPSLNDCLYSGASLTRNIVDIMMRFRAYKVALTGDIEKAFLMIHVAESDRDALRFLWVDDVHSPNPKIIPFQFTRVVFGVSSSPFLLNATVKHHIEQYRENDPSFVETFLNLIYVDDLISGGTPRADMSSQPTVDRERCIEWKYIARAEPKYLVQEEQSSYVGSTLGPRLPISDDKQKILGNLWDSYEDNLIIDLKDVWELCMAKSDWDHPLQGTLKCNWQKLVENLREVQPVVIPRYYVSNVQEQVVSYELHGFCDASIKALMNVTQRALESVIEISKVQCWMDSKVALYWITQQEWKQYVQSRVEEIRGLFPAEHWSHCPGVENPADILSRGILPTQLVSSTLWWSGPKWLSTIDNPAKENCDSNVVPEEC